MSITPPCEIRPIDDHKALWLRGLLRYTRDIEMVHPVAGSLPNVSTLFCALTFDWGDRLRLLTLSYKSTRHARYIAAGEEIAAPYDPNVRLRGGVVLKLTNTASPDLSLRMYGRAYEVPAREVPEAIAAYNAVRRLKRAPERKPGPKNPEDPGEVLYAVDVTYADTQGECWSQGRNHVGEGHPTVDLA